MEYAAAPAPIPAAVRSRLISKLKDADWAVAATQALVRRLQDGSTLRRQMTTPGDRDFDAAASAMQEALAQSNAPRSFHSKALCVASSDGSYLGLYNCAPYAPHLGERVLCGVVCARAFGDRRFRAYELDEAALGACVWEDTADYDPRVRPWYQEAAEAGATGCGDGEAGGWVGPYADPVTNEPLLSYCAALRQGGRLAGVVIAGAFPVEYELPSGSQTAFSRARL